MRSLLDTEEEEETTAREITLSTASLLGIFFGLVLICGVFFGFGYSMGRGTGQGAQAASLGAGRAAQSDETTSCCEPTAAKRRRRKCRIPYRLPQKPASGGYRQAEQADDDASAEDAAPAPPKHMNQADWSQPLTAANQTAAQH